MKKFNEFVNEHRKISEEYSVGDNIVFLYSEWSYKEKKQLQSKEKGEIVDMYDYNDDNWGTLNIKVLPENKNIHDKNGVLWITQNQIVSKI